MAWLWLIPAAVVIVLLFDPRTTAFLGDRPAPDSTGAKEPRSGTEAVPRGYHGTAFTHWIWRIVPRSMTMARPRTLVRWPAAA